MIGQPITEDPQVGKCFYNPAELEFLGPPRRIYQILDLLPRRGDQPQVTITSLTPGFGFKKTWSVPLHPQWIEVEAEDDPNGL